MMKRIYNENIERVFEKLCGVDGHLLVIFKGFNAEFFSILSDSRSTEAINNGTYVNSDKSIDIEELEKQKGSLLINLFQRSGIKILWGYYEELIALSNLIIDLDKQISRKIVIVENNLFSRYYPLSLDKEIIKKIHNYLDVEQPENERMELYSSYYCDVYNYSSTSYGVEYCDKDSDYDCEKIPFYDCDDMDSIHKETTSNNMVTKLNIFQFKEALQNGVEVKDFKLLVDNKEELSHVLPLIKVAEELEVDFGVELKDRFVDEDLYDKDKYLPILKKYWGSHKVFRNINFYKSPVDSNETIEVSQGEIITEIIDQSEKALADKKDFRDIFITDPTGEGKSLLFQIPAIHLAEEEKAVTIVITPLIALMRDQVEQLNNQRGISFATFLNSEISFEEKESRIRKIKSGEISILYMAPELLLSTSLDNIIGTDRRLGLLVIDEAHIVTTWGRDFRADYWFLGSYIEKLRKCKEKQFSIVCLTATAVYMGTEDTVNDTINTLALNNPKLHLGNVKRKNIKFNINYVREKIVKGGFEEYKNNLAHERVSKFIEEGRKALVYCPYTNHIEELYGRLKEEEREKVGKYYSKCGKERKLEAQRRFKEGKYKAMLCTKAFGMGIDISDIDTVYHYAPTGNLSDYVQEIGRAARDENMTGYAVTDYTNSDLKYVRVLSSLSSIRQYQLKEVLRKIYSIYNEKKKRNILISPDNFSYLFGSDNLENKVKTSLLLLQKDINKNFNVLIVRPKTIFTKNFVNVPHEIEEEFIAKYGKYAIAVKDNSKRIIPGNFNNSDIVISNTGSIYEVNMSDIWSTYFSDITFPDFKWKFFKGELFRFSEEAATLSPRLHLSITYKEDFEKCKELLKEYSDKLSSIFNHFRNSGKFFKREEFKIMFKETFKSSAFSQDLSDIILNMFVADISENTAFNQNVDKYKFIQYRKSQPEGHDIEYRIMNSNYITIGSYLLRELIQCAPNRENNVHSSYICLQKSEKRSDIIQLATILELFRLGTYELVGGKNTEIFIRINDPMKIKRLANGDYSNGVLKDIERKRRKSQNVLKGFMEGDFNDDERWEIIENYFLGNDEFVEGKLGIS
ncbi:DEAD/DEAH box helicase [Clostridium oryzae]|uniref:DNA 3'-5' helicase n=1 Tax=Clostridium oryzae TaxID=1450648 RepID=A0A1V4IRP4_9CLOT|nr:helicase-related protein [Clostridium oryzae]OPJ62559.1 ATP-dependent DNA helicase RecQ [Clostridium oryzae]